MNKSILQRIGEIPGLEEKSIEEILEAEGKQQTLVGIGRILNGMTREGVRKIESTALNKLRKSRKIRDIYNGDVPVKATEKKASIKINKRGKITNYC